MLWQDVAVSGQRQRFGEDYQLNYFSVSELAERISRQKLLPRTSHSGRVCLESVRNGGALIVVGESKS